MGIFDSLGQKAPQNAPQGMTQEQAMQAMQKDISSIKASPASYLHNRGFNVPDNMTDARQITQYLLQTGQIGNQRLQQVMQMIGAGRR